MKVGITIALNAFVVGSALSASLMTAQAANTRTIDQYTCKDVMREHGDNRDVTIAFLHGFLLGKSGGSSFDIDALHKQTSDFIEYCLDNPSAKAVDAMSKIKS
jgi:HdeA/HdeB family